MFQYPSPFLKHNYFISLTWYCMVQVCQLSLNTVSQVILFNYTLTLGTRGGTVGYGTALQARRSRIRFPMVSLKFFI